MSPVRATLIVLLAGTWACVALAAHAQGTKPARAAPAVPPNTTLLPAPILPPQAPISARAPYAPEALMSANGEPPAAGSVVLDKAHAQALTAAQQPRFVTRIDVRGSAEPAPVTVKPFQQRFADALDSPPYVRSFTYRNSTEPCPSIASAGTSFSPAFNVYGICP